MDKQHIDQIFNKTTMLVIPFYQRSYVWKKDNWDRMLEDLKQTCDNDTNYFMGTCILKQIPTNTGSKYGAYRYVIDGQQRFTTIILFFLVLSIKNNTYDADFKQIFISRYNEILLQHNHNDIEIFNTLVKQEQLTDTLKAKYEQNSILQAYNYFMEHINPQDYDVNKLLNYIYFVPIDLDPTDDEQQIFDTINSLGVRLTTADLLKNELFSTSTKDIDFYNSTWRQCFEEDEKDYWEIKVGNRDGRTNVDLFLYAYLSIFSKAKVSFSTLFNSYKEYLTPSKMIPGAYEGIVTKLIQYANSYKEHIQPDIVNNVVTEPKNSIQRLNIVFFGLETATLLPYCLYVLNNAEREEANKIFGLLETYIARRMLCHDQTKNYNKLFAGFITSEILTSDKLKEEFYNKRDTEDRMPTDEDIERLINYNHTNTQIKGLLYLLETGLRQPGKETTNILSLQSYDLEHIMPKDHSKWDSPDDTDEIIKNRETHIWSIGNKTLLSKGLNKSLKNEIYSKKLNGLSAENPGYKTFAMGLRTFNVDNYPTWDEDKIDERQKFLIEKIKEVWPYNTVR